MEERVNYSFGWGRADLISESGQVWEVKRDKPRQIARGATQVNKYADNTWDRYPNADLTVGGWIDSGSFVYQSGRTTYYVTYRYAGDGVIAYDYQTVTDWQTVGAIAAGVVIIAGAAFLIYSTGGAATPVFVPLLT